MNFGESRLKTECRTDSRYVAHRAPMPKGNPPANSGLRNAGVHESVPVYSTSTSCSSKRYNFSSTITCASAPQQHCYQCPKERGPYLNQQLQVPVIEEMHLAVPTLCHLQKQQHSSVRKGRIHDFPGLHRTTCGSGARTVRSKRLICTDKGIDSVPELSVLLQGLGLGSCLSTLSSRQLQISIKGA